jgi:NADH-quinone oxidoreductase subunit N
MNGGAVWLVIIGLLNSGLAAAYYLRLALATAQRPADESAVAPAPLVGAAVGAALLFAVAATLALGIAPGNAFHAAESGAQTLRAPSTESSAPGHPAGTPR